MWYKILLTETKGKIVIVEANNVEDAEYKVRNGEGDSYPDPSVGQVVEVVSVESYPEQC